MGHITIHFVGLCIHIAKSAAEAIPREHRIVLLENRETQSIHGHDIAPHLPEMKLRRSRSIDVPGVTALGRGAYGLHRVSMRVLNEHGPYTHDPKTWVAVPQLTPP